MNKLLIIPLLFCLLGCSKDVTVDPIEGTYTGYMTFENTWLNPPNFTTSQSGIIVLEIINIDGVYTIDLFPGGEFVGDVFTYYDDYFVNGVQTLYHITTVTVIGDQLQIEQLTNIYDFNTSELDSFFTGIGILDKQF